MPKGAVDRPFPFALLLQTPHVAVCELTCVCCTSPPDVFRSVQAQRPGIAESIAYRQFAEFVQDFESRWTATGEQRRDSGDESTSLKPGADSV